MPLFNPFEPPSAETTKKWGESVQSSSLSTIKTITSGFGGMLKNLCKTTFGIASAPFAWLKGYTHLGVNIASIPNLALQQIAKMSDRIRTKIIEIGSMDWLKASDHGGGHAAATVHH